jgi:outer membrane protein
MTIRKPLAAAFALLGFATFAQAQDAGDWIVRVGVHSVQPKSDNHALVNVDDGASLSFSGTYMFASNWGVEVLAALPFEHDIKLNGGGKVAKTKHLPPTLSLQYHFNPNGTIRPYVGAGLNYTVFFDEGTSGALAGSKLELDSSFGIAGQAGLDIAIAKDWFANIDVRWMDIDTKAKLNGTSIGTVEIDPYTFGISVGRRF